MITIPEDIKREGITPEDIEACANFIFQIVRKKAHNRAPDAGNKIIIDAPKDIPRVPAKKSRTKHLTAEVVRKVDASPSIEYQMKTESTESQQLTNAQIHSQILHIVEHVFPGTNGVKFLASILRYAEIKQNTLPGMEDLGKHVAIIQTRTLHTLAKKIGWGYDTTHKYIIVLCALNLLYRRRCAGQSQLIFAFECYKPPTHLEALDALITQSRPKVQQFAKGVKERFQSGNFLVQSEKEELADEPQYITTQQLQQRVLAVLHEEDIDPLRRRRIALRLVSEVFGQLVGPKAASPGMMPKILSPMEKVSSQHEPASFCHEHESTPQQEEKFIPPTKVYLEDTHQTPTEQRQYLTQPGEKNAEDIIKAAAGNKRIPKFALEALKKGLARNAQFRQQQEMVQGNDSTSTQNADLLTNHTSEISDFHESYSSGEYPPRADSFSQIEREADYDDTHYDHEETCEDTYQQASVSGITNGAQISMEENSFPEDETPTPSQRKEHNQKGKQGRAKKKAKSTPSDTENGYCVDQASSKASSPQTQGAEKQSCKQESLPIWSQSTLRLPKKVDFSDCGENLLRNYDTSLYKFIDYLFNNDTSRNNHELEKFLSRVFDKGKTGSETWFDRIINNGSPQAIQTAFLEVALALFAARCEKIKSPGALFTSRCNLYNTCEWHTLEKKLREYVYLADLSYEQLIEYLEARQGIAAKEILANSMSETAMYREDGQKYQTGGPD